jgi:integrase/recombinase XerC
MKYTKEQVEKVKEKLKNLPPIEDTKDLSKQEAIKMLPRKQRQRVTMPDKAKEALLGWLEARGSEPGPLFVALDTAAYGKRLTGDGLCRVIKKLGKKAGVTVKPHGLRHAAITRALDVTNGDIRKVRQFSRHKSHDLLIKYDDNREDFAKEISELVY